VKPWADEIQRHVDAWSARLVAFHFNPNTRTPGPFQVAFSYREAGQGSERTWKGEQTALNNLLRIQVPGAA